MTRIYNKGTAAIQVQTDEVVIYHSGINEVFLSSSLAIKGIDCDARHVILWSGTQIHVHRILGSRVEIISEMHFQSDIKCTSLSDDSIFIVTDNKLVIMSLLGEHQNSVDFSHIHPPILLSNVNINNKIAVIREDGFLRVFEVTKIDDFDHASQKSPWKNLHELAQGVYAIGKLASVKANATASLLSIVSFNKGSSTLFIFNTLRNELKLVETVDSDSLISHCWDPAEPRLLACCYSSVGFEVNQMDNKHNNACTASTTSWFIDEESGGIYQYEKIHHNRKCGLIGLDVPYILFSDEDGKVSKRVMSDFKGLEEESPLALAAMLDFIFYARLGDINKSFESLQAIKNPFVWKHLAPTCIEMKRLDLLEICLSHAASPEGLASMDLAKNEHEIEAALACGAIQFGLYDIAKGLYIECKRYDLLNHLLQKLEQWDVALKVAEFDDRVHLDLTKYNYARFLENNGEIDTAVNILGKTYVKKSLKFKQLVREGQIDKLENFVAQNNDPELYAWFGQFNQSLGNKEKARDYFLLTQNDLKLVELHCTEGNFDEARRIVEKGGNHAAAHYLAKFYTGSEALKLYSHGGMFNSAIRVAMEGGLDFELFEIANKCNIEQASTCAKYFEARGMLRQACTLYARSGDRFKALKLCLSILESKDEEHQEVHNLFISIVKELDVSIPLELLETVLIQLQQAGEINLILDTMCSNTQDYQSCLQFCTEHNICLTDHNTSRIMALCKDDKELYELTYKLALKCTEQENHKLACNLYTSCGEKKLAISSLFKTGDVEAIIAYANKVESKVVYFLTASYLQKLEGAEDDFLAKSIIQFYDLAEKYDKLLTYLISLSQRCVEKTGAYKTAIHYLKEASIICTKLNNAANKEIKKLIGERVSTMEWFVYTQESFQTMDRLSFEEFCLDLLSQQNKIIRDGDCYALLVKFFSASEQYDLAYNYLNAMFERGINPYEFIDRSVVKTLLQVVGKENALNDNDSN